MIYEKLMKLQQELKVPKGQYNKFGNFKYRSCEDILEAIKPLLDKNKLVLFLKDEIEQKGDRYYIKATATIIDTENSEKIENTAYAREQETKGGMDSMQITGSASSYARKYCLNGLLLIDDTKDADSMDNSKPETATPGQIAYLSKVYTGSNLEKLLKTNGINKIEELPKLKANDLIVKIKGGKQ